MTALTPAQRVLSDTMSDVSELAYCAGWMDGTEYEVWRLLHEDSPRWGQAGPDELAPLLAAVEKTRRAVGCWIVWGGDTEQPIDYLAWFKEYERWAQQRRAAAEALGSWLRRAMDAAANDPEAVLHRIALDRLLLEDFLAEKHQVVEDPGYICPAATLERDGGQNYHRGLCACGLDYRTEKRIRMLAQNYGWKPARRAHGELTGDERTPPKRT